MTLESKIEAVLFFKGESVSKKELSRILGVDHNEIEKGLNTLRSKLAGGLVLVENDEEVSLGTHSEASSIIEQLTKEDLERDIGKAGLETLTIILYRNEASKKEIDYIRGVNSGFILRNLMIRGLVNRIERKGERSFVYTPTLDLQKHLGIATLTELPEYDEMNTALKVFLSGKDETEDETSS